jgi:hypothetical protein
MGKADSGRPGKGMKWRVMVELTGSDGIVRLQEVSTGGTNTIECSAGTVGLTLADGKRTLAGLQDHLVRAQADEYCRQRRGCSHCGSRRPLKDVRGRRLLSLFGTVEVRAPRFLPCQCAVSRRHTLNPVAEIMPDRCMPSTSILSRRWDLCCPTLGPERCCRNSCRSATFRRWRRPVGGPCGWALGWNSRRHRANPPRRRPKREQSHSPSTAVTCARSAVIRFARSR